MDKRKEMKFEPEKQIDFVKLIETLDWEHEISPVILVKTVNKVAGLTGRWKYETNEVSYGALIKSFEKRVAQFVDTRFHGKDRFYTIKKGVKKEQIVHFAKTGKLLEIKEELGKKDPKFYIPEVPEAIEEKSKIGGRGRKRSFPDNEALAKTIIVMGLLAKSKGKLETAEYNKARDEFGWKRQRSVEGKLCTNFQETNKVTSWLDLGELFEIKTQHVELKDPKKNLSILEGKITDIAALIDDEELKEKALEMIKPKSVEDKKTDVKEEKPEVKVEETKPKEEVKPEIKEEPISTKEPAPAIDDRPKPKRFETKPTLTERPRIFKASPEVGKSEFRETGSAPSMIYEGSKTRWYKSLIGGTLKGAERGVWYNFNDISQIIKKTRFVEIGTREIKDLCGEISKQWKGIFREVDFGGITVGSETLVKQFIEAYPAEKITETIFLRLHMDIDELQETYPELNVKIASEISERDNVYEIEMNRAEKTEKAFAKLVYRMRQGEIILESPSNWTIKRTKILIDKLFGNI
jgi:hypothetical protein